MDVDVAALGALAFGSVIGWCASIAIRQESSFGITQLGALIGAVGGGAVTAIFQEPQLFAWYCIGLAVAFFLHRFLSFPAVKKQIERAVKSS